ncbi:MAG: DUF2507 domain-containing protein [Chitinispirillia bacterium]|jgi:hypothetical protein
MPLTSQQLFKDISNTERPTLGTMLPVSVFRMLRIIALPDALGESAGPMLYTAGKSIGSQLPVCSVDEFLTLIEGLKIGIPKVLEQSERKITVQIDECTTCAGLPNVGQYVCNFEGGIVAGTLETLVEKKIKAKEIKCWANGDGCCVFDCIVF